MSDYDDSSELAGRDLPLLPFPPGPALKCWQALVVPELGLNAVKQTANGETMFLRILREDVAELVKYLWVVFPEETAASSPPR
jgi:hypothetical protein